jgi:hypothetical protein
MQIELTIDGEKKTFTAPFVPMAAKRRYVEIMAKGEENKNISFKEQLEEDNAILSILTDIVFKDQFTLDDLYNGASQEYVDQKLLEIVYGVKPGDKGNSKGK